VKLSKMKRKMTHTKNALADLKKKYDTNVFDCINTKLNDVTKAFIKSQLVNASRSNSGKRWTEQDKAFALSMYKRGPRLYKFLHQYFELPSPRSLQRILSKIPFETGINKALLEQLKVKIDEMDERNRYASLIFDEMSLSKGFHYEAHKQIISGYEDLGELGRTANAANHALVFMIRGIRKSWKQIIAYYFTTDQISCSNLKFLLKHIIEQLQDIGIKIKATVCDQGSTQRKALSELSKENNIKRTSYTFMVRLEEIVIIFDVPHLLKNTRNALIQSVINYDTHKVAKFQYIYNAFKIEQQFPFKLYKLKESDFNFKDSYLKMKVQVAARQLSRSVANAINVWSISNMNDMFPAEALETAEFVELIDNLFDSLNGWSTLPKHGKVYNCCLQDNSPHLALWNKILSQLPKWKLFNKDTGKNVTNTYHFIKGWEISIRSIIALWNSLKVVGLKYLNLRNLNQDSVENLFCQIRQHGVSNTAPTCHQFIAALKTVGLNNLSEPITKTANCKDDYTEHVCSFRNFIKNITINAKENKENENEEDESEDFQNMIDCISEWTDLEELNTDACQALSYVSGYIVKKIHIPDNCLQCQVDLFATEQLPHHLLTIFKEHSSTDDSLTYPSNQVIVLVQNLHNAVYKFCNINGHKSKLESTFKEQFFKNYVSTFCSFHRCDNIITSVDKSLSFLIFKYVKDKLKKKLQQLSSDHYGKIKHFIVA